MLLQTLSLSVVGFLILVLLFLALMVLRLERIYGESPRGLSPLIAVVLALCTYIALITAYARTNTIVEPQRISGHVWVLIERGTSSAPAVSQFDGNHSVRL